MLFSLVVGLTLVYQHGCSDFVNVALHKQTYQIDTKYSHNSSLAVDGNTIQYFWDNGTCSLTKTETDPYWFVDLGAIFPIDHVIIYKRMDPCCSDRLRDVDLYLGLEEGLWSKVAHQSGILDPVFTFQLTPSTKARRVKIAKVGTTGYLSLCEVKVMVLPIIYEKYTRVVSQKGSGTASQMLQVMSAIQCGSHCAKLDTCTNFNLRNISSPNYLLCDLYDAENSIASNETGLDHFVSK